MQWDDDELEEQQEQYSRRIEKKKKVKDHGFGFQRSAVGDEYKEWKLERRRRERRD